MALSTSKRLTRDDLQTKGYPNLGAALENDYIKTLRFSNNSRLQ